MDQSDYLILGAGASGLMLAYRMAQDSFFDDKSIVIIDKTKNKGNDRTWCYWESGEGEWDLILHKTWDTIYFGSDWFSKKIIINPYRYKMIRSEAFYSKLWDTITKRSNITFYEAEVQSIDIKLDSVKVKTSSTTFNSSKVFNSLHLNQRYKSQTKFPVLQQHFIGWFIKTKAPHFDDTVATFMDFEIPQRNNTRFMYVLPKSKTEALFEYTLFSKTLLPPSEYEDAIKDYLRKKGIEDYIITEKEQGSIPMTSYDFSKENSEHILNIGTAGGWTKASTGYTFMNTTKKTKALMSFLKSERDLRKFKTKTKFWYYDLLLLDVLAANNGNGAQLFSELFKKTHISTIFKFLDEESSVLQDLKIITAVPPGKFVKALLKRLF